MSVDFEQLRDRASHWLEPIPGASPGGAPAKLEPTYQRIASEVAKLDLPAGGAIDWKKVAEGSEDLLCKRTKDLVLASYLAHALHMTRGIDGLTTGVTFLAEMLDRFWDTLHPEAKRLLETHYPPGHLNEARLRMAMVPEGATLLPNPISRAPGFQIGNVFVLPGVPSIMQGIFEQLKHRLVGGEKVRSRSVSCHLAEGTLAKDLGALQARYPELEIGSYPYFRRGDFGVTLVLRGTDSVRLADATRRGDSDQDIAAFGTVRIDQRGRADIHPVAADRD